MAHIIAVLAASLAVFVVGHLAGTVAPKSELDETFHAVGPINGKTFYIYKGDNLMNWFDGNSVCEVHGLKYAAIKNDKEFEFVRTNRPDNHDDKLWVGSKLKGQPDNGSRAFEWQDGSEITVTNFHQYSKHYLCLSFSQDQLLHTDFCIEDLYKPMCQTP